MLPDAIIGALVGELLRAVLEMKDKALKFRDTLVQLEKTLNKLDEFVKNVEELKKKLDRPNKEIKGLIDEMKRGKKLVRNCNKVQWWNCFCKANYQEKLQALDDNIIRFFNLDLQGHIYVAGLETQVTVNQIQETVIGTHVIVSEIDRRLEQMELMRFDLRGACSPPRPPAFTFGMNTLFTELKHKLMLDQMSVSVFTVTGLGGSGKSTLAKMISWDDHIRGKFKDNIFFITVAKTPKLNTIVQRMYEHSGYKVPEFQSDEDTDAVNRLEWLLFKQITKSPILLVLDDVWFESVSLVDKFLHQIPNCMILVTSRSKIHRFGHPYTMRPLAEADAINLFCRSASLDHSNSDIPQDVVKQIVRGCHGSPLALTVCGRSLSGQELLVWQNRADELSMGRSILEYSQKNFDVSDVLSCLQKNFDVLNPKVIECFRDLGLFPEAQRIPATALVDMWAELHGENDVRAMEIILELVDRNLADMVVTRKVVSGIVDYNYHYVTLHGLLQELAILQRNKESTHKRNRLIINVCGNKLPEWWNVENEYHITARILSLSSDEAFTSKWCNLQPTEVEVLVLNLREKKCTLPMFMDKMNKLKVLIITNYDFCRADIENFELLDYLSELKRIRLEKVSIPFLSKTGVQLKNLQKFSFFMCNVNVAFKNETIKISDVLPNLKEINIDYCDTVELPGGLSDIISLKKLSITNCHKFSTLPEEIGNLVNLESLKLTSCSDLEKFPDSITGLHNLRFLGISGCVSLWELPENIGDLSKLEKLHCTNCSRLSELPNSVTDLKQLKDVICDERTAELWEPYKTFLTDMKIKVEQIDVNLIWLS
ncbi:hypothetical protein RJT34_30666 [Clitoria ternatea]|uniref:RPW8 domain-containing protein n=1 Tax=Clitoria ternatea TaxID=43366 RepID=A0AAN9ET89_CLITE